MSGSVWTSGSGGRPCLRRGIDLSDLRARLVELEDFLRFEYVLAMDQGNFDDLSQICPPRTEHKLRLFMDFAPHWRIREVPDPYYGATSGFERVLDMVAGFSSTQLHPILRSQTRSGLCPPAEHDISGHSPPYDHMRNIRNGSQGALTLDPSAGIAGFIRRFAGCFVPEKSEGAYFE